MNKFSEEIRQTLLEGIEDFYSDQCYIVKSIPYSEAFISFVQRNLDRPNEIFAYASKVKSNDEVVFLICQTGGGNWKLIFVFDPVDVFQRYEVLGLIILEDFAESDLLTLNADKLW